MLKISKFALPVFLIFLSLITFSQTKFSAGYVVLNNGDTLKGFLKEDTEGNLLSKIVFSNNENGSSEKEYTLKEAKAFYYNKGNYFESVYYNDINSQTANNFAKLVINGYYQLYSFRKKDLLYFVLKHNDSTWFLYDDAIAGVYAEKGNYRNILSFVARDCKDLRQPIETMNYFEKNMINIVTRINNCIAPGTKSNNLYTKPESKTYIFVQAGVMPLGEKYDYAAKAGVRIFTPSISKNVCLNIGLAYLAHKSVKTKVISYDFINKYDRITDLGSLSLTLQNNFTNGKIRPYIEGGLGVAYKHEKDPFVSTSSPDFQNKFGIDIIGAIGIEGYITKQFALKADWRYELIVHYPTVGIIYLFK